MGSGCRMECPQCGYKFNRSEGVGFLFPMVYAETVEKAKKGKLGKEIKQFFEDHEDGAIDVSDVTLCCEDCGFLSTRMDLTMYLPKDGKPHKVENSNWSSACTGEGLDYVMNSDLDEYYMEYMKYPHKCKKCKGKMHIVKGNESLLCPKCKVAMEIKDIILWD